MTLEERNAELERQLAEQKRENAVLRQELEKLRKEIEEWKRGFRERGKRRTSKAEAKSGSEPKKPGRKAGHPGATRPMPDEIHGTIEHPAKKVCDCGGSTVKTDETESVVLQDIPPVGAENIRHVAPVRHVLDAAGDARDALREALAKKDRAGVRRIAAGLPTQVARLAESLVTLWGPATQTLERARVLPWPAEVASPAKGC